MAASTSPSRRPMRSSPPRTLTIDLAVCGSPARAARAGARSWPPAPDAASIAANVAATSGSVGLGSGGGAWPCAGQDVLDRQAQVGVAVVGGAEVGAAAADDARDGVDDRGPAEAGRALVGLRERPAGQEHRGDRQLVGLRLRR